MIEDALRHIISVDCGIRVEGVVYSEFLWIADSAMRAERRGG